MDKAGVILITLIAYKLALIGIGLWAQRRTRDNTDFFLGGRALGPVVAAISYSASASSAWTLLGVSGAAYVLGVSVVWVAAGSILGAAVAWLWIAPRLRQFSRANDTITLTDFIAHGSSGGARRAIVLFSSLIIMISFLFYIASQFQGAGNAFATSFGLSPHESILIGAGIIMVYTLLGGFWAVSVTDTLQGLLMAVAAVLLPLAAMAALGGPDGFRQQLLAVSSPSQLSLTAGNTGLLAIGAVAGSLAIGMGTYGQPHLLVRFMALKDESARRHATALSLVWYVVVFGGMCIVGLAGHALALQPDNPENVFFVLTDQLFVPVVSGVLLAAVLSAIMSTADSQLLVAASAVVHDLGLESHTGIDALSLSRLSIVGLVVAATLVALLLPSDIFSRVLFAWIALGSAFGPLVFVRLAGREVAAGAVLASMVAGFGLAVLLYLYAESVHDLVERLLPFAVALLVLLLWPDSRTARGPAPQGAG